MYYKLTENGSAQNILNFWLKHFFFSFLTTVLQLAINHHTNHKTTPKFAGIITTWWYHSIPKKNKQIKREENTFVL